MVLAHGVRKRTAFIEPGLQGLQKALRQGTPHGVGMARSSGELRLCGRSFSATILGRFQRRIYLALLALAAYGEVGAKTCGHGDS